MSGGSNLPLLGRLRVLSSLWGFSLIWFIRPKGGRVWGSIFLLVFFFIFPSFFFFFKSFDLFRMINVHGQVVLIGLSASVKVTTRCIGFTRRPSFAEGWNHVVIVRTVNGDLTFHQITISPSHFNGTVLLTQTKVIKSLVLINQSIRCDYFGLTNSMRFKSVVKAHYCRNAYGNEYFFCFF